MKIQALTWYVISSKGLEEIEPAKPGRGGYPTPFFGTRGCKLLIVKGEE
jgi:hypothetical protein